MLQYNHDFTTNNYKKLGLKGLLSVISGSNPVIANIMITYMVVNFRTYETNRSIYKLTRTSTLIIIKKLIESSQRVRHL